MINKSIDMCIYMVYCLMRMIHFAIETRSYPNLLMFGYWDVRLPNNHAYPGQPQLVGVSY
jgi:hypothetical protein